MEYFLPAAAIFQRTDQGSSLECDQADGTCDELKEGYDFRSEQMSHSDALSYKYVLDV